VHVVRNGYRLYFDLVGGPEAPVVAFSHSLAADSGMWAEQVPAFLTAGYRLLRIDMRGHGGSDAPPGNYSMRHLAEDVLCVLDGLELSAVDFCGLSIGGAIGQHLGINHPDRVRNLILCDTQPASFKDALTRWGGRIETILEANSMEPIADATLARWLSADFKASHPVRWRQVRGMVTATTLQGYIGCAAALQNFNFVDDLPRISAPVLVICGENDPGADPELSRLISGRVRQGTYREIPRAGHLPNIEKADLFNATVLDWLKGR
jgi:3-oxoadipate enol-lactonase